MLKLLFYSPKRYFHQARLIMNRHLYRPPIGLPLDNLHVLLRKHSSLNCQSLWTQQWSAKVIDNELLYLCANHSFAPYLTTPWDIKETLWSHCLYNLCPHVRISEVFKLLFQEIPAVAELQRPSYRQGHADFRPRNFAQSGVRRYAAGHVLEATIGAEEEHPYRLSRDSATPEEYQKQRDGTFVLCKDKPYHCRQCLMDYDVSIEWIRVCDDRPGRFKEPRQCGGWSATEKTFDRHWVRALAEEEADAAGWYISIAVYQNLGACRSSRD